MKYFEFLIQDVLKGKVAGHYILRNGKRVHSADTFKNCSFLPNAFPYKIGKEYYTDRGRAAIETESSKDIVAFQVSETGEMWKYQKLASSMTVEDILDELKNFPMQTRVAFTQYDSDDSDNDAYVGIEPIKNLYFDGKRQLLVFE